MVFHPPRTSGLAIGLSAVMLLLGLDAGFAYVLTHNPLSLAGVLGLALLLASLPVVAVVGYRTYGLWRSRYVLSRNAIVVEWGSRRIVLPMAMLDEVRAAADLPAELRPRGLTWPGNVFGTGPVEGLGEVEFLAAAEKPGLVLLRHAEAWLAISPADPPAFLAALEAARSAGPQEEVEPESAIPAVQRLDVLRDRLALALIALGTAGAVLLLGYLAVISPQLPAQIALHFDAQGLPDRFGPPSGLLILPAIAGLTWLANTLGGLWLHRSPSQRPTAYVLLAATLFVQALVWVATISLLTAGNATCHDHSLVGRFRPVHEEDAAQQRSVRGAHAPVSRRELRRERHRHTVRDDSSGGQPAG
jgi:hypothetical protein